MDNPNSTFPPQRWRPLRLLLVAFSSLAFIGAFAIFSTTYDPKLTRWISVLLVLGVLWRVMAYFWPDRWVPRWPGARPAVAGSTPPPSP